MVQDKGITQGIGYTLVIIPKEGIPATSIAPIMGMGSSSGQSSTGRCYESHARQRLKCFGACSLLEMRRRNGHDSDRQ